MYVKIRKARMSPRVLLAAATVLACLVAAVPAMASNLQDKLDTTQAKINDAQQKGDVLSTDIERFGERIGGLETVVSRLRNREAAVEARLSTKQAELEAAIADLGNAHDRLLALRSRLRHSVVELSRMLVSIYRAGDPDFLSVVLSSKGYEDFVGKAEYIDRIQSQDEAIVGRVRTLRDEAENTVGRLRDAKAAIERARNEIASRKAELTHTRTAIEGRESALLGARADRRAALASINSNVDRLEDVESSLQQKLQEQIAEATGGVALPAGPIGAPSAAGLIWPVDGPITSGYGYRWGSLHEGIDIAVPEGTPIRAAAAGTVIIAAYTGGYGNYTCVDHGGGLSTCYGHQSSFAVSVGDSVGQGDIIGYSGNTGHSTGPHLHFEVRINGASTDPLGYL